MTHWTFYSIIIGSISDVCSDFLGIPLSAGGLRAKVVGNSKGCNNSLQRKITEEYRNIFKIHSQMSKRELFLKIVRLKAVF